jgi:hypothetical protein
MIGGRASVGTLAWALRSGGRLSRSDQLKLMVEAMLVRLNLFLRRQNEAPFSIDVGSLRIPDSALCIGAGELLVSVSEPWLVNHCLRTYLWAAIVGTKEQRTFDEELLFVASLLHDLGLTSAGSQVSASTAACFAVEGAFAAEEFLEKQGVDESRRKLVAEAISMHLNVRVPLERGVEAHLLHEGAAMDVVGSRFDLVNEATRNQVLVKHPRLEMKSAFVASMKQQSIARPYSRAGFLCRHGFVSMIRRSPFVS